MAHDEVLARAIAFAQCLDKNDFAGAKQYLRDDCRYLYGGSELVGPQAILDSYERNYLNVKELLNEIVFESEIEASLGGVVQVRYLDRIRKGDLWHQYRCRQNLRFRDGKIVEITHVDLPGEAERLASFFSMAGIKRGG